MPAYRNQFPASMNDGQHIFVFGSNLAGRHGAGAAFIAWKYWGAVRGDGVGPQGNAYAIPTKDHELKPLPLDEIKRHVEYFLGCASQNPEKTFLVTRIGCGLAGYTDADIGPMFANAPNNCVLPSTWKHYASVS